VGLSTYEITLVPRLWLLTQRTSYRIFQHLTIPAIARALLDGWSMTAASRWCIREDDHPPHPYRVQYGETDHHFLCRLLEESGIATTQDDTEGDASVLVLSDALHQTAARREPALQHIESPTERSPREWVTRVSIDEEMRPDALLLRDQDFRRPLWSLLGEAQRDPGSPYRVERYHPGAFLIEREADGWHEDAHGAALAARALESARAGGCRVSFETNAADLRPGSILRIEGHPRAELDSPAGLLVTSIAIEGSAHGDFRIRAEAVPASEPYRPPRRAAKPAVYGVQSATVIGPPGQEIHTDEHGRVRVQFPWDREGQGSCWLRVGQGWAGAGLGLFALPRIGQEVLVTFLGGDPDQPIIVGRVGNALNPPPLKLPEEKTQSVWKSATSPGGEGWSEIRIEDSRGVEFFSMRAERDMGMVIRRDRTEAIGGDQTSRIEGRLVLYVGQDAHVTTAGEHRERVGGMRSVTVDGDQHQRVGGLAALGAGAIHIQAEGPVVIEGGDITLRGPGGFVRIDGGGVTIDGGAVNIQKGGAPGGGPGAEPAVPLVPERADERGPGPRRLPLIGFPGLPPIPMQPSRGGPRPLTPEELIVCGFVCQCKDTKYMQVCVTQKVREYDAAQGGMSNLKAEVPYDMTTTPPRPIMSRKQPWRPSRGSYKDSRKPDV
ncbi:MAG TPA: type VI secretion system tip protein TssI/VgrG, partial [Candidatus Nanopelagicales bacterium]|nr:type VI secretion system tip protein TssI/VgrG [Candidatus Nanopelagicales bacterium]